MGSAHLTSIWMTSNCLEIILTGYFHFYFVTIKTQIKHICSSEQKWLFLNFVTPLGLELLISSDNQNEAELSEWKLLRGLVKIAVIKYRRKKIGWQCNRSVPAFAAGTKARDQTNKQNDSEHQESKNMSEQALTFSTVIKCSQNTSGAGSQCFIPVILATWRLRQGESWIKASPSTESERHPSPK
jgi:hypothetical protein